MSGTRRKKKLPPLFVIKVTMSLRNFFLKIGRNMLPPSFIMLEEVSKIWKLKAIEIVAKLNIADLLKNGPQPVEKLAEQTANDALALYRVMRALAAEGIFKELPGKVFKNTRLSNALADQNESVKYFSLHHLGDTNWELTGDMHYCVETGNDAFGHKFNSQPFEFLEKNPEQNSIFNKAMTETAELSGSILVDSYPFGNFKTIVDIGGGQGLFLAQILTVNTHSKGILADQPHVAGSAHDTFKKLGLLERCSIVECSFFETVPANGDLYIMKNILHDWDDETSVKLLKNLYNAMPQKSRLLIIETIIKPDNKPSFGKFIDLQMLIGTQGGKERTMEEFNKIIAESGFRFNKVIHNATPFSFIEAVKNN